MKFQNKANIHEDEFCENCGCILVPVDSNVHERWQKEARLFRAGRNLPIFFSIRLDIYCY
jgi:hypothetical protein